jgi:chemotaxis signal transduction protein/chemotaxis regulatin CheY-phosphate phosphatase CheZ
MQYIGFKVNDNEFTVPILKVQEIINRPPITKLPQATHWIEGITNLRGRIIPIVDLKKAMGMDGASGEKIVVLSNGRITFGILVDSITGVISLEDTEIEPASEFNTSDIVTGIAKRDDRLLVLLDTKKLIPVEDLRVFEDEVCEIKEMGDKVEVSKKIKGMGGDVVVKEIVDARDFFESKGISINDPRYAILDDIINFMDAIAAQDYEKADMAIQNIIGKGQSDLFKEVGKVTRKLHNSLKSFKEAIDPKIRDIAVSEMPCAIDRLQFVINKTEEAANKTMGIVEKYILSMDDVSSHIRNLDGPEESVTYLKNFKNSLENDLTEILTAQSFQDITGQTIKKVIELVGELENELVKMITTFGVKIDEGKKLEIIKSEKVSQEDVDDLLKEFGF